MDLADLTSQRLLPANDTEINAASLLELATQALVEAVTSSTTSQDGHSYETAAREVLIKVLTRLGGQPDRRGLLPFKHAVSQQILQIADELDI